jgi:hypothetical protein
MDGYEVNRHVADGTWALVALAITLMLFLPVLWS